MLQTLVKRGITPTLKSINQFLHYLFKTHKYNLITQIFSQINRNHIKTNSQTHSIFIGALFHLHRFQEADHFITTNIPGFSLSSGFDSPIRDFCGNKTDPLKAWSIFRDFLTNYGEWNSYFMVSLLIHCFLSLGNVNGAVQVLALINDGKVKYPLDNFVCSSLISGFCNIDKPEIAVEIFENFVSRGGLRPTVVTYTAFVTALTMLGRDREVSDLIRRVEKDESLALDVAFYSNWVFRHFREGALMEAFRKNVEMVARGIKPDVFSYTILIDGFSKEGNVEKAVGFLDEMIESGIQPNLVTFTALLLGFCRKGKMEEAFSVFNIIEKLCFEVDEFVYAIVVDGLCRKKDFERVYQLLEDMEKKGLNPSIVTYNTLLSGLCKIGKTSVAEEISKGIIGDIITYTALLNGYVEEENAEGILEIKRRYEEAGLDMDIVMCNTLIKAFFFIGTPEDAYALYKGMQEMDLVPSSVTYCTMINGYCKAGRIDEALQIFDDFRRTSSFSVTCYNCMISCLCKNNMVDVATEIFIELNERRLAFDDNDYLALLKTIVVEKGAEGILDLIYRIESMEMNLDDRFCNDAIRLLCKSNFPSASAEVYLITKRNHLTVTSKSYHSILRRLIVGEEIWLVKSFFNNFIKDWGLFDPKVSNTLLHYLSLTSVQKAFNFINKMSEKKLGVSFPASVLKALTQKGRSLDAYELIMAAKDNLQLMDVVGFSIVVDGLSKEGHPVKALDLCVFAEKMGIALNIVTYNSVINGLCKQGCLVEAFRVLDSLESMNMIPSEITYGTLVDSLCREGYISDAKLMVEKMVSKGYKMNTHICNSLLSGHCMFGQVEEALKILNDMERNHIDLDEFTISSLIYGYSHQGDMEGALEFFHEYKEKCMTPDFLGFLFLARGLCSKGRMEEARSILREMLQSRSVIELINRVNSEVETESIQNFLISLCEGGSIKEAVTVLDEIGLLLYPVRKSYDLCYELEKSSGAEGYVWDGQSSAPHSGSTDLDCEAPAVMKIDTTLNCSVELGGNGSKFDEFHSQYSQIASLCSRGELQEANRVAEHLFASLNCHAQ